jgi:hypothetical protein
MLKSNLCKFVLKTKLKAGQVDRYKARLCARGFVQKEGIDYNETFAPVARMNTFRLFLKLAIDRGQKLYSIDFTTAFLNAPVELDLYLTPCDGIDCPPGHLFKLERALYGLKQAGRNWNSLLIELLVKLCRRLHYINFESRRLRELGD